MGRRVEARRVASQSGSIDPDVFTIYRRCSSEPFGIRCPVNDGMVHGKGLICASWRRREDSC